MADNVMLDTNSDGSRTYRQSPTSPTSRGTNPFMVKTAERAPAPAFDPKLGVQALQAPVAGQANIQGAGGFSVPVTQTQVTSDGSNIPKSGSDALRTSFTEQPAGGGAGAGQGGGVTTPYQFPTNMTKDIWAGMNRQEQNDWIASNPGQGSQALIASFGNMGPKPGEVVVAGQGSPGTSTGTQQGTSSGYQVPDSQTFFTTAWQAMFPGTDPKTFLANYFNADGTINIPEMASKEYLSKFGPMIETMIADSNKSLEAYKVKGANDLSQAWRDGWSKLSGMASSLGVGRDGLGLMMLTQGNRELLDNINGYNLDLLIKKGEIDAQTAQWAFDLIKYAGDVDNLTKDYYTTSAGILREMMTMATDTQQFLSRLGFDAWQANQVHNDAMANLGIEGARIFFNALSEGLLPPESMPMFMNAFQTGNWDEVRNLMDTQKASLPPADTYASVEDASSAFATFKEQGFLVDMHQVDTNGDGTLDRWKVNLILGEDGRPMYFKDGENEQIAALMATGKKINSVYDPATNKVTYTLTEEPVPADEEAVVSSNGTITYRKKGTGTGVTGSVVKLPDGTDAARDNYEGYPGANYEDWKSKFVTTSGVLNANDMEAVKYFMENGNKSAVTDYAYLYSIQNRQPGALFSGSTQTLDAATNAKRVGWDASLSLAIPAEDQKKFWAELMVNWGIMTRQEADNYIASNTEPVIPAPAPAPTGVTVVSSGDRRSTGRGEV